MRGKRYIFIFIYIDIDNQIKKHTPGTKKNKRNCFEKKKNTDAI